MKYLRIVSGATIAASFALSGCNVGDDETLPVFESEPRTSTVINDNWTYQQNYSDLLATSYGFDDSGLEWEQIDLPHSVDKDTVINADPANPHFRGMNTYRKRLTVDLQEGVRQYLEFDGAAMITKVFVNGAEAGEHTGGFMRFRMDITDFLVNGENVIVVQLDNRPYDPAVHAEAFLPMETGQDYTYYGGIYRDLKLLEVNEVGIDAEDYGASGVYFMQMNTTDEQSEIYSNIRVRNKSDEEFEGYVVTTIQDASGNAVYADLEEAELDPGEVFVFEDEFTLEDIHLWDGVNNPYLYSIYVQVYDEDKQLLDQVEQPLGLRYFEFDAERGFLLNGKEYRLNGVAMHQDRDVVGWSTTQAMREADLDLIREMGANSVRFSHYPHHIDTSEYSNEVGFINYLELPVVNAYLTEADAGQAGAEYLESTKEQMRALIRQNFNYPSMALIGNSNEIGMRMPNTPANTQWLQDLSDVIHAEFGERFGKEVPYRKSTIATVLADEIGDPDWDTVQMPCHNRYFGWYVGQSEDVGDFMDEIHATYPEIPVCFSEYGAGVSTLTEYASEEPVMADHSTQYGNLFHEAHIKAFNERPFVWGTYVWNMFDFSVATRNEGDTIGRNDKGLVKFDHETKKEQFYLYQANWSDEPMIFLVDKNLPAQESREVKVFSSLDAVTLSVNGIVVNTKQRSDNDPALPGVFKWTTEEIESVFNVEEENLIEVSGQHDGQSYLDSFSRFAKQYSGSTIKSDDFAVITTTQPSGALTGKIAHLPEGITYSELKALSTLSLGANWDDSAFVDADANGVVSDGDVLVVLAANGSARTYLVEDTESLAALRDSYSSFIYQFTDPGATDGEMFDNDLSTAPIGIIGLDPSSLNGVLSVDLGAVFFVDTIEPVIDDSVVAYVTYVAGTQGIPPEYVPPAGHSFQVFGDILGTDKLPYTSTVSWARGDTISVDNGAQAMKRLELLVTETNWLFPFNGTYVAVIGLSEVYVYGGLIKGGALNIDYKAHTFSPDLSITTLAELDAAITKVDSLSTVSDAVSVEYLNASELTAVDLASVVSIKVTQNRNGQIYSEEYTRL